MKQFFALSLLFALLLTGCHAELQPEETQYTATFLTLFDTVTTVVGRAESEEAFHQKAQAVHDALLEYHQLFDIYHDYDGIHNLKTVNDQAGITPVTVDGRILDLLQDCKSYYDLTGGRVNASMGSVLSLWQEARSDGWNDPQHASLPDEAALQRAAAHSNPDSIVIDETASTVFLADPELRLDVGAIAKGWAVQAVSETLPAGLLISVGGNVCATGPKDEHNTPWVVGIRDPDGSADEYLHTVYVYNGSVVTSGDYQRVYQAEGRSWHHIIDPDTLYPSEYWRSVTVLCRDSGLADALSTALFLLPLEDGQDLLHRCDAEAMWVAADGSCHFSPGFEAHIRT